MVLVGIRKTESTEASCEPPHSPKWEDWSLVTSSLLTGLDVVMCGPLDERNKLYSGRRRDLDNIKLLITHNLTKRNASSLPEAVNWAGENQGKREGMWVDTCLTWGKTCPTFWLGWEVPGFAPRPTCMGTCVLPLTSLRRLFCLSGSQFLIL